MYLTLPRLAIRCVTLFARCVAMCQGLGQDPVALTYFLRLVSSTSAGISSHGVWCHKFAREVYVLRGRGKSVRRRPQLASELASQDLTRGVYVVKTAGRSAPRNSTVVLTQS